MCLHLINLISLNCSYQNFAVSGSMTFSLLNSDGKKEMNDGCVLSSLLFANSLFGSNSFRGAQTCAKGVKVFWCCLSSVRDGAMMDMSSTQRTDF